MVASRYGHDPCINLLLDFGANIDLPDTKGNRPIHVAVSYGHLKAIRTLVDRNCDTQSPNSEGWIPLEYCCTYQVEDYFKSLVHEKQENSKKQAMMLQKQKNLTHSSSTSTLTSSATQFYSNGLGIGINNSSASLTSSTATASRSTTSLDKPLPPGPPKTTSSPVIGTLSSQPSIVPVTPTTPNPPEIGPRLSSLPNSAKWRASNPTRSSVSTTSTASPSTISMPVSAPPLFPTSTPNSPSIQQSPGLSSRASRSRLLDVSVANIHKPTRNPEDE